MFNCAAVSAALLAFNAQAGDDLVCRDSEAGLAIARDAAQAAHFTTALEAGHTAFVALFGETPAPAAIVQGNAARNALAPALEAAGHARILPWIDEAEENERLRASVRAQIEAQAPGLPAAQQAALIEQALARRTPDEPAIDPATEQAAIAHELGHLWYIDAFWPGDHDAPAHYGGHAPDWLDEMAAVALETGPLLTARRAQLRSGTEDSPGQTPVSLDAFLDMEHPLASLARIASDRLASQAGAGAGSGSGSSMQILRLSGDEADALLAEAAVDPASYYVMARGFLDYLTARTGEAPLAELSRWIAGGGTLDSWLAAPDHGAGLPRDRAGLIADWQAWLDDRQPL